MKKLLNSIKLIAVLTPVLSLGLMTGVAHAAGTATYSLVQSGNSVSIYEDSGSTAVNTVDAELAYGGSQPVSVSTAGSPFTSCTSSTSSSVVCFVPNTSVTGSQLVATLNYSGGSSTQVNLSQGSMIVSQTPAADIWDHASGSGSFSFAAPAPAPVRAAPVATTTTTPTTPTTPAVKADSTKNNDNKNTKLIVSSTAVKNNTSRIIDTYIVLIVLLVAAVAYEARRRMVLSKEAALAGTYKLASSKKGAKSKATSVSKSASTKKAASKK